MCSSPVSFNGRADQVAIIPAASYGIATIARNIKVGYGDNLVLIQGQFPSNVYSWHRLAENTGAAIRMVEGHGANWTQRVLESIDYRTSVVAMGIVHWTDGTLFDVKAIGKRARDVGAVLIIDGTQSIGALPFDVQEIQPDALVCSGYKWLMGPYGTGLLYVGERFLDGIHWKKAGSHVKAVIILTGCLITRTSIVQELYDMTGGKLRASHIRR